MAPPRTLRIGTRGSKLALVQSEMVRDALMRRHPGLEVELVRITTRGDTVLDRPLAAIGGKGLFVTEIEDAMRDGRVDLAVHSAKDLPSELPLDMTFAAIPAREDARDVLVASVEAIEALPEGARVGTSSPRRQCQLRALRPDLDIADVRGNVDTRLRKLDDGQFDAIVLAAAGLNRLGVADPRIHPISPEQILPAVGQGALGIETRAGDTEVLDLVAPLHDAATAEAVVAERAFLAATGGGCDSAVAAHATVRRDVITITGMIGTVDGAYVRDHTVGPRADAIHVARELAQMLLARGGAELLPRLR
jgi:hydroxymethylbilane synthase